MGKTKKHIAKRKKSSKRGKASTKPAPKAAKRTTAKKAMSKVRRADTKPISEGLRPDESPLGSLTSEEQSWLATALAHLSRIYENREAGRPGKNAFCVFEVGNVYVQFLAPWDAEELLCEAASAKSVPEVAARGQTSRAVEEAFVSRKQRGSAEEFLRALPPPSSPMPPLNLDA